MKTLFNHPFLIYVAAACACLCVMTIADYFMGAEAEHLNAWVILNRLAGRETHVGDSLAIRRFGLAGATVVMLVANGVFGTLLIALTKGVLRLFH